jgi:dihydrofolate reductase
MKVSIIVAIARNGVIGSENRLPWHIPDDFKWFRKQTSRHAVIMGRSTFESIGKPLPERANIILSRRGDFTVPGAEVFPSLDEALEHLREKGEEEAFVIGGAQVYRETLPFADRLYLTLIRDDYPGDARFPPIPEGDFHTVFEESHAGEPPYSFVIMERRS